ncbi:repeat protein [Moumouvirus goulette]|uniref:Repeat protein n=1 Tax=Moumouvirus goulette TaxID=1247379 RepID=M1PAH9_9VIRU|nr:repeat protein [Moumouvirus goulette]AGF84864.1 repeat protein [Moumouvirus goulette]
MSSKLYFKLITHNSDYHDGLNIDTIDKYDFYNITEKLFFCESKNIGECMTYYKIIYLYDVYLPTNDPKLTIINYKSGEYGANKIILQNRRDLKEITTWEYMISNGLNIFDGGNKSLVWACMNNHTNIIKYLVDKGIDINIDNGKSLEELAYGGYFDNFKYLVENGADIHTSNALYWASHCGHFNIVKYLVESGANINETNNYNPIRAACISGHNNILKYLLQNGATSHTINLGLTGASMGGHLDIVKCMIDLGAEVNFYYGRSLNLACYNKHVDVVKYLLDNGSIINVSTTSLENISNQFYIVKLLVERGLDKKSMDHILKTACFYLRPNIIKYLLESGADINTDNDKPLLNAIQAGNYQDNKSVIQYLIENGSNIHTDNNESLNLACNLGQFEIVKLLVTNGADIYKCRNETLVEIIKKGYFEIIKYLVNCGIDIHTNMNEYLEIAEKNKHSHIIEYLKSL